MKGFLKFMENLFNKKALQKIVAISLTASSLFGFSNVVNNRVLAVLTQEQLSRTNWTAGELAALNEEDLQELASRHLQTAQIIALQRNLEEGIDCEWTDEERIVMTHFGQDTIARALARPLKSILPCFLITYALNNIGNIINHLRNLYVYGGNILKNWMYRLTGKGIDIKVYEAVVNRIEKRLRNELVGQDKAIDRIVEVLTGYFESMVQAEKANKKFEGGLVIYLTGAPATGKTTAMKIIEEEMGLKTHVCRMSDAIEDKGNGAQTVATRLTKPVIVDNGNVKISEDTPLTRQLKAGLPTLYCFDETDKMRNLDSILQHRDIKNVRGKIVGGTVDEMIRNFGDTGQINGINASGSVLIATSNETPEDLSNLEESLYNRYRGLNVRFRDFDTSDYKEIIRRKTKAITEFYKNEYGVDIKLEDSLLNYYSEKFEKEKSGGRAVEVLINDIRAKLKLCREHNLKEFKNVNLFVSYDNKKQLHIKLLKK